METYSPSNAVTPDLGEEANCSPYTIPEPLHRAVIVAISDPTPIFAYFMGYANFLCPWHIFQEAQVGIAPVRIHLTARRAQI